MMHGKMKSNDNQNSYPHQTGFVRHSDTSAESARKLDESGAAGTYDAAILQHLDIIGMHGATAEEMRKFLNQWHPHVHNGSINGRMSTLWKRRDIIKLTATRTTDANKRAHVYVHAKHRDYVVANKLGEPEYAQVTGGDPAAARQMAQMLFDALKINPDASGIIKLAPLDLAIVENLAMQAGLKKE